MSRIECPICHRAAEMNAHTFPDNRFTNHDHTFTFLGVISCSPAEWPALIRSAAQQIVVDDEPHSFPMKFTVGTMHQQGNQIGIMPPPHVVDALDAVVKEAESRSVVEVLTTAGRADLIQDIEEAKAAKLWELYKASAVMCRRIINIALADCLEKVEGIQSAMILVNKKWVPDDLRTFTLGTLLQIEQKLKKPVLNIFQRAIAKEIKEVGDDGAHNKVELDSGFIDTCIRESAIIAAVLVSRTPASQSETSSNGS